MTFQFGPLSSCVMEKKRDEHYERKERGGRWDE